MNLNDAGKLPLNEPAGVPRFDSAEDAQSWLSQQGVKYVLAQFVDIHGVAKAKSVPLAHLKSVLKAGAGFAGFAIWGVGIEPNGPDYMAVGDLSTLTPVPWQPGVARIVCDGHVDGEAWAYDSRVTLKRQTARLDARGWTLLRERWSPAIRATRSPSPATTTRGCRAHACFLSV
jgi:glutamine synthetase